MQALLQLSGIAGEALHEIFSELTQTIRLPIRFIERCHSNSVTTRQIYWGAGIASCADARRGIDRLGKNWLRRLRGWPRRALHTPSSDQRVVGTLLPQRLRPERQSGQPLQTVGATHVQRRNGREAHSATTTYLHPRHETSVVHDRHENGHRIAAGPVFVTLCGRYWD